MFGVRDSSGTLDVVGVVEVDKVQNDFLSTLRAGNKLNRVIAVDEQAEEVDGKTLLVFHVPESPRGEKPVYLDGNIHKSYIRRGAGDERCTMPEIERFLRDAAADYDGQVVDLDAERFFDPESLGWYRRVFDDRNPGRRRELPDMEFLHEWGFVVERGGRLAPTLAAVLVLGRGRYVRQVLHRPVVDCQFINSTFDAWPPDLRWSDRVVVEENLVQAWLILSERYVRRADRPFRIDPATLRRDDDPPDYTSFRESAINLLLHQDYGDQGRHASIRLFRDRMEFRNPGDAFATIDELLEPGAKEERNPKIAAAFRRLGLSEQAGAGIRAIFRNWQALGHVPPMIDNDKTKKAFEVCLVRETLLSEEQRLFQSRLGLRLNDAQARVFAFACRQGRVSLVDAKAVTGWSGAEASATLEALRVQSVLQPLQEGSYRLAEHLEGRGDLPLLGQSESDQVRGSPSDLGSDLVTDPPDAVDIDAMSTAQVAHRPSSMSTEHGSDVHMPAAALSDMQWRIVASCDVPRLLAELMDDLGVVNRGYFKKTHLDPLIRAGFIALTNPAQPRAPSQRYMLTEAGVELKTSRLLLTGDENVGPD